MFRAIDTIADAPIVALDVEWGEPIERLRKRCRGGEIVCPGCRQGVRLRAGVRRRRHFAHESLSDCPLGRESYERLAARAMLYELLRKRFGDKVAIEVPVPNGKPGEHADCVVALSKGDAAYFVVPKQISRDREHFMEVRQAAYRHVHWVLLWPLLTKFTTRRDAYLLSATVRDLASRRGVEGLYAGQGPEWLGSLTFLYTKHETVVFLRGLHLLHKPNVYLMGKGFKAACAEVHADEGTAQLMHPHEYEPYEALRAERREKERLREEHKKKKAQARKERKAREAQDRKEQEVRDAKARAERQRRREQDARDLVRRLAEYKKAERERREQEAQTARSMRRVAEELARYDVKPQPDAPLPDHGPHPGQVDKEEPSGKALPCRFCGCETRYWHSFQYTHALPDGECVCNRCHAAGKTLDRH